jgi:hypothetical protein
MWGRRSCSSIAARTSRSAGPSATLLSVASGAPVFRTGDGILLGRSGPLLLPDLPEGLAARPSLLLDLDSRARGPRDLEVAYLTDGLGWSADYVLMLGADSGPADLSGWVTVENRSGASFQGATLKLVAGQLQRTPAPAPMLQGRAMAKDMAMEAAAAPQFQQEGLGDLHLYTLDRPVDLPDAQSTQLALLSGSGIPVTRRYLLEGQTYWYRQAMGGPIEQDRPVQVELSFENSQKAGLGKPLPRGTFRVYQRDRSGAPQITGEAQIDHTPVDETVRVRIGEAFDVVADRVQTDFKTLSPRQSESAYEISIRNRKKEAVTVVVREPVGGQWQVLDSTLPARRPPPPSSSSRCPSPPDRRSSSATAAHDLLDEHHTGEAALANLDEVAGTGPGRDGAGAGGHHLVVHVHATLGDQAHGLGARGSEAQGHQEPGEHGGAVAGGDAVLGDLLRRLLPLHHPREVAVGGFRRVLAVQIGDDPRGQPLLGLHGVELPGSPPGASSARSCPRRRWCTGGSSATSAHR